MASPTPAPWLVFDTHPTKACFYIDRESQSGEHAIGEVAVIYTTTDETKRANARLIAAAPDLLNEARLFRCLVTSPRFQSMTVAEALHELAENGMRHDDGAALKKAGAL